MSLYLCHKLAHNSDSTGGPRWLWLAYQSVRGAAGFLGCEEKQLYLEIWDINVYEYTSDIYRSQYTHPLMNRYGWHQVTKHKNIVGVYNFF